MAGEARRATVGDYVTLIRGTTYKGQLVGEPGPALLGLGSIEPGGGFRTGNYKTYGGDCPDELMLFPGDVYASLKGATKDGKMIGSVARVPPSVPTGRLTQDTVKLVFRTPDPADATYLYWLLRTPQYRDYCAGHAMGSAVVALSRRDFLSYPVPPPTAERRRVVALLDAIEEKIELNRRMNETLEAMARALFKSWFVDFDPVRAKAEGRDLGLPKPLADLFPSHLIDSDLGAIPEGWEVATIGNVAEVIDCLHSRKPERRESGLPLLQLSNIRDDGLIDMQDTYFVDEADYRKWVSRMEASPGDCVITNVGRVGAVAQMASDQTAALGRNMTGIRCKPAFPFPTVLIECLLSQAMTDEIVRKMDTGTILDALNVRSIPRLRFVCPKELEILHFFERYARPLRAKMEQQHAGARTLAALRDTLLPRLISGQLRVKTGAQAAMETAI